MYRLIILIIFICCSCNQTVKETIENTQYQIHTEYNAGQFGNITEVIDVDKTVADKFIRYIYFDEKFNSVNDTLLIGTDKIWINNIELDFIAKKDFKVNDKVIPVRKYNYYNIYSSSEVYLNNDGIIMVRIWGYNAPIIRKYDTKANSAIQKQIQNDTLFFKPI